MAAAAVAIAAALWAAGLRQFVRAPLSTRRKVVWSGLLVVIGAGVGTVLPASQLWSKFLLVFALLPLVTAADVFLFRANKSLGYWIQACGFEVVTVFAAASLTRYALDLSAAGAIAAR